jgi:hypothetical protein
MLRVLQQSQQIQKELVATLPTLGLQPVTMDHLQAVLQQKKGKVEEGIQALQTGLELLQSENSTTSH